MSSIAAEGVDTASSAAPAPSSLDHDAVTAALRAALSITGMELAYVAEMTPTQMHLARVLNSRGWAGIAPGLRVDRDSTLCNRMLDGGPTSTADAAADPAFAGARIIDDFGITSYVGVPVEAPDGTVFGTLCGIDRASVSVQDRAVHGLREIAGVVTAHLPLPRVSPELTVETASGTIATAGGPVVRRSGHSWVVDDGAGGTEAAEDLTSAMVLADLLASDLGMLDGRAPRPPRTGAEVEVVDQLRVAVQQLEHALAARVAVEQAIGVLAERRHLSTRAAFEALRSVARGSGRRVHDLAREVVQSTTSTSTSVRLPADGSAAPAPRHSPVPTPSAVARKVQQKNTPAAD